ncbi:DUF488 family protein [Brevundimonas diminuta]|uniref:DUF488 family protein n=1 Tax=Brevundimonas diminuta TaxID=293 RepID=UPI0035DF10A4
MCSCAPWARPRPGATRRARATSRPCAPSSAPICRSRTPEAAFQQLRHAAGERRVALLCFEADACGCHRSILADRLAREDGAEVTNL